MASPYFKILKFPTFISLMFLIFVILPGCGDKSEPNKDKKDIIAYVNKEPIYEYDLKREIALRSRVDSNFKYTPDTRNDQLDVLINKRIVIQEAMERGLARSDRFVDTMKAFWEQTLVRDFLDLKKIEFSNQVPVTEGDIRKYYDNLSSRVTFKILKSANKSYIDEIYNEYVKSKNTAAIPFETFGPIGYDEIGSNVLLDAFEQPIGEVKRYPEEPYYYLIAVDKKDEREIGPFESIKNEIAKRAAARKEMSLFEDWLKEKRRQSKVKIIKK